VVLHWGHTSRDLVHQASTFFSEFADHLKIIKELG